MPPKKKLKMESGQSVLTGFVKTSKTVTGKESVDHEVIKIDSQTAGAQAQANDAGSEICVQPQVEEKEKSDSEKPKAGTTKTPRKVSDS